MLNPNLYIVGFQKCGSSSLYDLLTQHSKIAGTNPKETYYLSDEGDENFAFSKSITNPDVAWENYLSLANIKPYIMEASVNNFYQEKAIQYVAESKESKVIFILRDPIDRFVSNYKYYSTAIFRMTGEISAEKYFELVKNGFFERDCLRYSVEHGRYETYIDRWVKAIGSDRVLLTGFSKLISKPQETLDEICRFLSIESEPVVKLEWKNESTTVRNMAIHNLLASTVGKSEFVKRMFKTAYEKLFTKKMNVEISETLKSELRREYSVEYEKYSHLF